MRSTPSLVHKSMGVMALGNWQGRERAAGGRYLANLRHGQFGSSQRDPRMSQGKIGRPGVARSSGACTSWLARETRLARDQGWFSVFYGVYYACSVGVPLVSRGLVILPGCQRRNGRL